MRFSEDIKILRPTWVLGIDPGVKATGIVATNIQSGERIPNLVARTGREDIFDVMFKICGELDNIACAINPVFGVIEYPATAFQSKDVFEIAGLIRGHMFYASRGGCKLMYVQTLTARKSLVGFGAGDKDDFIKRFEKIHGKHIPDGPLYSDENVEEALGLSMLAEDLYLGSRFLPTKYSVDHPEKLIEIARFVRLGGKKPRANKKGKRLIV